MGRVTAEVKRLLPMVRAIGDSALCTSVNCTLTLLSNKTRISGSLNAGQYAEDTSNGDGRFVADFVGLQLITTSHAQSDSCMFELNFRDERYLPFEGAGVISPWRIELPIDANAFDFNTLISKVGTVCASRASTVLCGGRRVTVEVTVVPTATEYSQAVGREDFFDRGGLKRR
jgi:hypothetical protein